MKVIPCTFYQFRVLFWLGLIFFLQVSVRPGIKKFSSSNFLDTKDHLILRPYISLWDPGLCIFSAELEATKDQSMVSENLGGWVPGYSAGRAGMDPQGGIIFLISFDSAVHPSLCRDQSLLSSLSHAAASSPRNDRNQWRPFPQMKRKYWVKQRYKIQANMFDFTLDLHQVNEWWTGNKEACKVICSKP